MTVQVNLKRDQFQFWTFKNNSLKVSVFMTDHFVESVLSYSSNVAS